MRFVDTNTGEIFDTSEAIPELKRNLESIKDIYRLIRHHGLIVDDVHRIAFYSAADLMYNMIRNIEFELQRTEGEIMERHLKHRKFTSTQLKF